jgi:F0F1-type ATP synthase epsilon subunit
MSRSTFIFRLISPTMTQEIMVEWVEIESPTGSFLVGADHSPLISLIKKKSLLSYKKTGEPIASLEASGGIFKVSENIAIALLD